MFGSAAIELAIGLTFLYLLLGALCSHVTELVAGLRGWRATALERGLHGLLGPEIFDRLRHHPLVRDLGASTSRLPSYLPARIFSGALLDVLGFERDTEETPGSDLRPGVAAIAEPELRDALTSILADARNDRERFRGGLERWFDAAMDQVSGRYKRRVQTVILALALFVSFGLGVDSLAIAQALWQAPSMHAALIGAAQSPALAEFEDSLATVTQFDLPVGWTLPPQTLASWMAKVVGLIVTLFAVSHAAPLWFDLLRKISNPRSTGPLPDGRR
jgi:hypothetical protein